MTAPPDFFRLAWAHGDLTVRSVGGMIAPLVLRLADGRTISPLHVAPWVDTDDAARHDLAPLLAGLRGEWPCLPFGPARIPDNLPPGWQPRQLTSRWDHGYCSNHPWQLLEQDERLLRLAIDLPETDPAARLERTIRADAESPAISVELVIHPRRDAVVPFALHPTFVVPAEGVRIGGGHYATVHTYPMPPEPGVSRTAPGRQASSLSALPTADGGTLDVTRLPLAGQTEELLQIADCRAPVVLHYPAPAIDVVLEWDTMLLPDALIWISNGGRPHAPWSGRHFALGIEPTNSCFDLSSVAEPPADHPLASRRGITLQAGQPLRIAYRLSARSSTAA